MKIAFFTTYFPKISETFVVQQITGLIQRGHEVDIYSLVNPHEKIIQPDVLKYNLIEKNHCANMPLRKELRVVRSFPLFLSSVFKFRGAAFGSLNVFRHGVESLYLNNLYELASISSKGLHYDIIHAHFGENGKRCLFLKHYNLISGKLITTFHGSDCASYIEKHGYDTYNDLFKKGDLFLPVCEERKNLLLNLGCPPQKIKVHHMGVNVKKIPFRTRTLSTKKPVKILTVARFVKFKGLEYGVKAIKELQKYYPDIVYSIIGEGPLKREIERLVIDLEIQEKVKFIGSRDSHEVLQEMIDSDIFLLPSFQPKDGSKDGVPVVLMEALATGLTIVSTIHGGIPEVVVDGRSGFLVKEGDVNQLTEKLHFLIQHPEIWSEFGKFGRQFIEKNFNSERLNVQLESMYKDVLTQQPPAKAGGLNITTESHFEPQNRRIRNRRILK